MVGALLVAGAPASPAGADTAPAPGVPETVTATGLPTVQINGVVWAQVIVGNTVYVTGSFTQARPAGAAPGTNQTPRSNILAYNLTTGNLITTWAPTLNGQGVSIAASANGQTIYVGGSFTSVNGTSRNRIAAINATTGALTSFNANANNEVSALAVSGNTVFMGGHFTSVGGQSRAYLAAVNATSGALLPWNPSANREVVSMVFHAGTNRVIVGGSFTLLDGQTQLGMGSLDAATGDVMPWAANQIIQNSGDETEISSLTTDGEKIYGVGWSYLGGGARDANFEGSFAADPATGAIDWVDGTRGDSYGIAVSGDVVYVAGHSHDAGMLGWQPQENPYTYQRALAIDKHRSPTLTNAFGTTSEWGPFSGMPAAQPLHWLPTIAAGTYTGQAQGGYSVAANDNYLSYAGEFPRVNNVAQQGIVRFAKRSQNPPVDAIQGYPELTPVVTPIGPGTVRIGWEGAWDRDNAKLTVEVLRGNTVGSSTVIKSFTTEQQFWNRQLLGFVDTTAAPGSTQTYRIRVTDPYGNGYSSAATTATIPDGTPVVSPYANVVNADNPTHYWRLGEASDRTGFDTAASDDMTLNTLATRAVPGALLDESDTATSWPSTSSTNTVQGAAPDWQLGPQTFSLESWVNTTSTQGGKVIGFGSSRTGRSSTNGSDRHIYMTNNGSFYFGVRPDMGARVTINSAPGFNDGTWHQVVGTLSSAGMNLYVDGNLVASDASITKAQVYQGYWRIAGDRTQSWPSAPTREALNGSLDEVAVYPTALSLSQIQAHYEASGRDAVPNVPPTANFNFTTNVQNASFTSTSTDVDGTITNWAWDFGDTTSGSGATTSHSYGAAGTYPVTLTVTDSDGATSFITRDVTVADPPPNVAPTAAFTHTEAGLVASLDAGTSTDSDGSIVSYAWDFGDTTSAAADTSPTASHTYTATGTYPVTVTVTDNVGATDTETHDVTVTNAAPTASFTSEVTGLTADVTSTSTDSDGTITGVSWDFGDSTPLVTTGSASHAYANPGTYTITLTATDNAGGTDTQTADVTVAAPVVSYATDLFGRTVANGLGNADFGGAWTLLGSATSFSVNGSTGRIAGVVGANRAGFLEAVSQRDFEATADISLNTAPSGGGSYVSLIGRRASNNNDYRLRVRYQAGGTVAVYLVRVVNNADTIVTWTSLPGTYAPNDVVKLRFQVSGTTTTTLRAKAWNASATEPAAWTLTGTDAAPALLQAPGNVGILHYVSSSWSGAAPVLTVDNFNVGPIVP